MYNNHLHYFFLCFFPLFVSVSCSSYASEAFLFVASIVFSVSYEVPFSSPVSFTLDTLDFVYVVVLPLGLIPLWMLLPFNVRGVLALSCLDSPRVFSEISCFDLDLGELKIASLDLLPLTSSDLPLDLNGRTLDLVSTLTSPLDLQADFEVAPPLDLPPLVKSTLCYYYYYYYLVFPESQRVKRKSGVVPNILALEK